MRYYYALFIFFIISCEQKGGLDKNKAARNTGYQNSTIPEVRNPVHKDAVASYLIPMGDARLERKFGVEIYETSHTFKYLLEMHYDGMVQNDTLKIPNTGRWPVIKVMPGKEKLSCIIGFLDNAKDFREYKLLSAHNNSLKLTVLKSYGVTAR